MYEDFQAIKEMFEASARKIEIVENENPRSEAILEWAKIPQSQDLAAVVNYAEVITVDDWIHVLGHGKGADGQTIFKLSSLPKDDLLYDALVVATDVLGGLFAICVDKTDSSYGDVFYLQPECLEWEPTGFGYSEFLVWLAEDDLDEFYQNVRWEGWRDMSAHVGVDSAIRSTPDVWFKACDFSASPRQIVPFKDVLENMLSTYILDDASN
jgi:hypothetical protein